MNKKVPVTEQTLQDLLDNVGLLIAGMDNSTVELQIAKLRSEISNKPAHKSATIYQFRGATR